MTQGSLAKEFHNLLKNVKKMSENQATVSDFDDGDVANFKLEVKPHSGFYKGGTFVFDVKLPEFYPYDPPQIRCLTKIYHPNIDPTEENDDTNICLNMFQSDEWNEVYGMDGLVQGILFLFYEPNIDDPLSPFFEGGNWDNFEENVKKSLRGEEVDGVDFPRNYDGNEDDDKDTKVDNSEGKADIEKASDGKVEVETVSEGNADDTKDVDKEPDVPNVENENGADCKPESNMAEGGANSCNTQDLTSDKQEVVKLEKVDEVQKGSGLCVVVKPKEANASNQSSAQPDVIPKTEWTASPDVTSTGKSYSMPDILDEGDTQKKCSTFQSFTSERGAVKMQTFDSVMPELGIVFAVLNTVTRKLQNRYGS